jgi:hypothetical protein
MSTDSRTEVDDHDPAAQGRADDGAAFAMVLGFLAVIGERHIAPFRRQRHRGGRGERNALVGRAEQHVELDAGIEQRLRIEVGEPAQGRAVMEQPGVEEIRGGAAGLGDEFAKAQDAGIDRECNETLT